MIPNYTLLDHTADFGMRVYANDLEDLFIGAAQVLMQLLIKGAPCGRSSRFNITVEGIDLPDLMVRWLGEILYLFEGEHLMAHAFHELHLGSHTLDATVIACPFNPDRHEVLTEIKAVTYHESRILFREGQWEATVIFDV